MIKLELLKKQLDEASKQYREALESQATEYLYKSTENTEDFVCDCCRDKQIDTLYEGWFYTSERYNPYAQGTASSCLMQLRRVCKDCLEGPMKKFRPTVDNG